MLPVNANESFQLPTTSVAIDIENLKALLTQSQRDVEMWRTRFYENSAENVKTHLISQVGSTLTVPSENSDSDSTPREQNEALSTTRAELAAVTEKLKACEEELVKTREELVRTRTEFLQYGNDLSVAQSKVKLQQEMVEIAQRQAAQYRDEANTFCRTNRLLSDNLKHLKLKYESHGQLLNKLAADLKALGKPVDVSELVVGLADECEELARTEGGESAIYKRKTRYLHCLLKTADEISELRTREQRAGASFSQKPIKPTVPTKPRTTRKTKK